MAAAQASRTSEEIWANSKVAEEDREVLKEKKLAGRSTSQLPRLLSSSGQECQVLS